jgi:3-oxoacyl-[acyl-carrier-protein] synthase-3
VTHSPSIIIAGIGAYIPIKRLTNDDLARQMDTSDEWISSRTGIRERRIAAPDEQTSDMGVKAAQAALDDAKLAAEDIDLLIVGTMTPDMPFPSTACLIQHKLGCRTIPSFDLAAACTGFLYLIEVATQMLRSGNYRHALIIGAEKLSSILDWEDRSTCVLFGDGAGACVLSRVNEANIGILDTRLGADGSNPTLLHMPSGGTASPASTDTLANRQHYLKMNGREIFKQAVRAMGNTTQEMLAAHQLHPDQIACVVPHQANIRIIEALAVRLAMPMDRFIINIDRYGNTSAASIPLALHEALTQKRIQPGNHVLLVAFGAGLTWGATLLKWPS